MRAALHAELLKLRTVRGLWLGALLSSLVLPVVSLAVAASGGLSEGDTLTSGAASGTVAALLAFGAWGAAAAAGEHVHGTLAVSLVCVPRRERFLVAKLGALAGLSAAAAAGSSLLALLVVRAVVPSGAHDWGNPLALLAVVAAVAAVTVAGAAAGVLARSTTAAVVGLAAALLLPQAAAGLLGSLQPWVVGATPGPVVTQVVGGAQLPGRQEFPAGTAAAVLTMLAVALGAGAAAGAALARRDA